MIKAFVIAAAVALSTVVSGQGLTIASPPALVECQPIALSWSGGTAPYILAAIPGGQTSAAAIETISDDLTGTSTTWTVNLAAGTTITLKITDATGTNQYTGELTIQAGASNSCLNSTATSAAGAAGVTSSVASISASSTVSGSAASSAAASSMSMASSASSAAMSASMTSSAAASSSPSSSAAPTSSMASSAAASASSAAASASKSGAAVLGAHAEIPAIVLAAVGGLAALL